MNLLSQNVKMNGHQKTVIEGGWRQENKKQFAQD